MGAPRWMGAVPAAGYETGTSDPSITIFEVEQDEQEQEDFSGCPETDCCMAIWVLLDIESRAQNCGVGDV